MVITPGQGYQSTWNQTRKVMIKNSRLLFFSVFYLFDGDINWAAKEVR